MSKYSYDFNDIIDEIKERLREARINAGYTQEELAKGLYVGRTAVTMWEKSDKKEDGKKCGTLPSIDNMYRICNILNVDMDYLLGASDIKSQDTKTIAETLNIREETVNTLKYNFEYGAIIDNILDENIVDVKILEEIQNRIKQIGRNFLLEEVLTTSFSSDFIKILRRYFNDFYFSTFPMDISEQSYAEFLKQKKPYQAKFDSNTFIEKNFLCEGKNFIYNMYPNGKEDFEPLNPDEKYSVIIESVVAISYEYFLSLQTIELSKQRLTSMLATVIDKAIMQETEKIKANIILATKKNIVKNTSAC